MRIHAICLVKDEVDIIAETLGEAQRWCDHIYVYDNGSTDGTWEQVQLLSRDSNGQIIIFKRSDVPFHDRLRGEVFEYYRENSTIGDWWSRLDADEMYIDDPRAFLSGVPDEYDSVYSSSFQYYFTDKDCEIYRQNPAAYAPEVSVRQKCRYYLNNWSELRFIRHKRNTLWDRHVDWPYKLAKAYPRRIRLKHYQYRSPDQIQKRIDGRVRIGFAHEKTSNWQEVITTSFKEKKNYRRIIDRKEDIDWRERTVDSSSLDYDNHDGNMVARDDLLAPIPYSLKRQILPSYCYKLKHHIDQFLRGWNAR
jgi:Glycosyl transferase family 2